MCFRLTAENKRPGIVTLALKLVLVTFSKSFLLSGLYCVLKYTALKFLLYFFIRMIIQYFTNLNRFKPIVFGKSSTPHPPPCPGNLAYDKEKYMVDACIV